MRQPSFDVNQLHVKVSSLKLTPMSSPDSPTGWAAWPAFYSATLVAFLFLQHSELVPTTRLWDLPFPPPWMLFMRLALSRQFKCPLSARPFLPSLSKKKALDSFYLDFPVCFLPSLEITWLVCLLSVLFTHVPTVRAQDTGWMGSRVMVKGLALWRGSAHA